MLRGRRAGPFARCAPALAREKNGAPSAPRRSRGLTPAASAETCHRHLSPASASRHKRRGRSASTRFPALCGSPRRPPRTTFSRPHSAVMQDDSVARNHLACCAGRRATPVGAPARGPPNRSGVAPAAREPCLGHSRAKAKSLPDGPAGSPRRRRAVIAPSARGHCP